MKRKIPILEVGVKYRVVYRLNGQRRDRTLLGTYLGENQYTGEFQFDLRPEAGTTSIEPIVVREAWEMPHTSEHQVPQPA